MEADFKPKKMKPAYEVVALLDARGLTNSEIEEATGYAANYICRLRKEVEGYDSLVADFKAQIQERLVAEAADIARVFNEKVPAMAANLETLALGANKEGVRLRATMDWLDRAPDAPKRVQRSENTEQRKIMIGVTQVDNMRAALEDVGAGEIIDLLEGEGFTEVQTLIEGVPDEPRVINADDL